MGDFAEIQVPNGLMKFEIIDMEKMTIGKATYAPGWKWSIDVSPLSGTQFCEVEHFTFIKDHRYIQVVNNIISQGR